MYDPSYNQGNQGNQGYGGENYGGNTYGGNNYGGNNYGGENYGGGGAPAGGAPPGGQPYQGNPQATASAASNRNAGPQQQQGGGGGGGGKSKVFNKLKKPSFCGKEDMNCGLVKLLIGEFLGTFLLVFFGIGSIITTFGVDDDGAFPKAKDPHKYTLGKHGSTLHISFAFGIAVASIAQAIGHVSGCHLNPAVSFGLVAAGECSLLKALFYSLAQIVGAITAAGVLKLLTWNITGPRVLTDPEEGKLHRKVYPCNKASNCEGWHLGVSAPGAGFDFASALGAEIILTFILVLVVCGVCDSGRKDIKGSAPLAIGFTVFLCHVTGIGFSGSSVNPARSIGPAPFSSHQKLGDLPIYIFGPIIGGLLAGFLYNLIFRVSDESAQVSPE